MRTAAVSRAMAQTTAHHHRFPRATAAYAIPKPTPLVTWYDQPAKPVNGLEPRASRRSTPYESMGANTLIPATANGTRTRS